MLMLFVMVMIMGVLVLLTRLTGFTILAFILVLAEQRIHIIQVV